MQESFEADLARVFKITIFSLRVSPKSDAGRGVDSPLTVLQVILRIFLIFIFLSGLLRPFLRLIILQACRYLLGLLVGFMLLLLMRRPAVIVSDLTFQSCCELLAFRNF